MGVAVLANVDHGYWHQELVALTTRLVPETDQVLQVLQQILRIWHEKLLHHIKELVLCEHSIQIEKEELHEILWVLVRQVVRDLLSEKLDVCLGKI